MKNLLITIILMICAIEVYPVTYHFANNGNDITGNGSILTPYATIAKANSLALASGDSILFKRGDIWRDKLLFNNIDLAIVLSAYGTGAKPKFYGSLDYDNDTYWIDNENGTYSAPANTINDHSHMIFYNTNTTPVACIEVANLVDLTTAWQFWYDDPNNSVVIKTTAVPSALANGLEITILPDTWSALVTLNHCDNWTIDNLDIRYSNAAGILSTGNYTKITNCDLSYIYNWGVAVVGTVAYPSDYNIIDNCHLLHSGFKGGLLNQNGEVVWVQGSTGTIVRNCVCEMSHSSVYSIWGSDSCLVENNYSAGSSSNHVGNLNGVYFDASTNSICRNNVAIGMEIGFAVNAELDTMSCHNINFYNNVAINNYLVNYSINTPWGSNVPNVVYNISMYNNVSYNDTTSVGIKIFALADHVNVKNNIFYNTKASYYPLISYSAETDVNIDYNNYYSTAAYAGWVFNNIGYLNYNAYLIASNQDLHSITTNPLFTSSADFHLQAGSLAINAGTNVGLPFSSFAPEMGAFEYAQPVPGHGKVMMHQGKRLVHNGLTIKY